MNVRNELGLANEYSYMLMDEERVFAGSCVVDEALRETKIVPDYSLSKYIVGGTVGVMYVGVYFSPFLNECPNINKPVYIALTKDEYDTYMYIRNNAFYTPYGMMILLKYKKENAGSKFSYYPKYFLLTNDNLIPKTRLKNYIDYPYHKFEFDRTGQPVAFFSDYIMDNMIMNRVHRYERERKILFNDYNLTPIVMKRVEKNRNIPEYDVQFTDLMMFDSSTSYSTYMLAVSNFVNYNLRSDISNFDFSIDKETSIIRCYPKEDNHMKQIYGRKMS